MNISNFNYIESILWFGIALIILIQVIRQGRSSKYFKIGLVSVVAFTCFGVSDIIEAQTGAWWRPVGLLIFKACCVLTFVWCLYAYKKVSKA